MEFSKCIKIAAFGAEMRIHRFFDEKGNCISGPRHHQTIQRIKPIKINSVISSQASAQRGLLSYASNIINRIKPKTSGPKAAAMAARGTPTYPSVNDAILAAWEGF